MTNPLLGRTTSPADRASGCFLSYSFKNRHDVVLDGGAISGTPVIDNGLVLNPGGVTTDYIIYGLSGEFDYLTNFSCQVDCTPYFAFEDAAWHHFFATTVGTRFALQKTNGDQLYLYCGATLVGDILTGTVTPYWNEYGRNVLTVSAVSGDTNIWLNGGKILDAGATAWTAQGGALIGIGSNETGGLGSLWEGRIDLFKCYNTLLTEDHHKNLYYSGDY